MLGRDRHASTATVIEPDAASQSAIGGNVFDPSRWSAVVEAATQQGTTHPPL
jgi:hypothetical protein